VVLSPAGLEPALQYATPLVVRRYCCLVAFNQQKSSSLLHLPYTVVVNAASITSRHD
jgi:hypothetical protein